MRQQLGWGRWGRVYQELFEGGGDAKSYLGLFRLFIYRLLARGPSYLWGGGGCTKMVILGYFGYLWLFWVNGGY